MSENELDSPLIPKRAGRGSGDHPTASPRSLAEQQKVSASLYAKLLDFAKSGDAKALRTELANHTACNITRVISDSGETLLHAALQNERENIVDLLIDFVFSLPRRESRRPSSPTSAGRVLSPG